MGRVVRSTPGGWIKQVGRLMWLKQIYFEKGNLQGYKRNRKQTGSEKLYNRMPLTDFKY